MISPHPSAAPATLRPDLGASIEEYPLRDRGFGALRILPAVESAVRSGVFGRIKRESLLRAGITTPRASGAPYPTGTVEFETDTFATEDYGMEFAVDERNAAIYGNYFDAELVAARIARDNVMAGLESAVASLLFNETTFTGSALITTVSNAWSSKTNGTPVTDVKNAKIKVYENCGIPPNAIWFNWEVFVHLQNNNEVIDRITAAGAGSPARPSDINERMLAQVFGVDEVIVLRAGKNTANEAQAAAMTGHWSKTYAQLGVISRGADISEPGLGRTIHWSGDGSQIGGAFESYDNPQTRSRHVRARMERHAKVFDPYFAHLLKSVA